MLGDQGPFRGQPYKSLTDHITFPNQTLRVEPSLTMSGFIDLGRNECENCEKTYGSWGRNPIKTDYCPP